MSESDQHEHQHERGHEQHGTAQADGQMQDQDEWNDPAAVGGQPQRPSPFQMAVFWIVHIIMLAAVIAPVVTYLLIGFQAAVVAGFSGILVMWLFKFILI